MRGGPGRTRTCNQDPYERRAEQCVDPQIRDQVIPIARQWEQQAYAKEGNTHAVLIVKEDVVRFEI
jgi:hypothetical protein